MSEKNNVMPNNLEAEQALLGCMIIDNDVLTEIVEQLDDNDFYQESHKYIFLAIKSVFHSRKPVDIVTLCDRLDGEGNLNNAGGIAYVSELAQITPSVANYKHYYDIVKRDSINRNLIRAAREIADYSQKSDDYIKSIQFAEEKVYRVSQVNDTSAIKPIRDSETIYSVVELWQKIKSNKDLLRGLPTGFKYLDKITNGLQKSDLIVIAARPGVGKTSFAMNIVEHAALSRDAVCAVFSLEMPESQLIQRLLCGMAGVSLSNALSGKLSDNDWIKIYRAVDALKNTNINIDDSSKVTTAEILSKCRRIKAKNNGRLDLVMIDYIQLMESEKKYKDGNRTQEVASITRDLKIMAKELNVPVVALSQLRRQSGEPQLTDLRESGAIEQDADIVMFIHRPDLNATQDMILKKNIVKNEAFLIIAKHRNGETARIKLRFKPESTKFVNPETDESFQPPPDSKYNQRQQEQYASNDEEDNGAGYSQNEENDVSGHDEQNSQSGDEQNNSYDDDYMYGEEDIPPEDD